MQKDLKIGMGLGLVLAAALGLWLCTRPGLSTRAGMTDRQSSAYDEGRTAEKPPGTPIPGRSDLSTENSGPISTNVTALSVETPTVVESPIQSDKAKSPEQSAPQQTQAPGPGVFHIVRTGETLSGISSSYYGSANKWQKIFDANRDLIKDANKLEPGTRLIIPD